LVAGFSAIYYNDDSSMAYFRVPPCIVF